MSHPARDPELALAYLTGQISDAPLFEEAARLRDEGKDRTITYSRKVFVPLTTLCRDRCTYCTFAKPPGAGGEYLTPDDVLAIVRAGQRHGCTEALLTLGDRPEDRWPAAREFLAGQGMASTLDYVAAMSQLIRSETTLFPHANPGLMSHRDVAALRSTNPSMGLMLENISPRLMEPGMPHHKCPDKDPKLRMATLAAAGELRVPFTTGVLIGIGETPEEIVESIFALARVHEEHGHLQEIIVQNFRAKADTPMRRHAEPVPHYFARAVAIVRWVFGAEMNVQVPPNLTERYEQYLAAGINDWGGVSPLTIDWVNPDQPWPHLAELEERTARAGFELRPRLPVYPEYVTGEWIAPELLGDVEAAIDERGYVRPLEGAS